MRCQRIAGRISQRAREDIARGSQRPRLVRTTGSIAVERRANRRATP